MNGQSLSQGFLKENNPVCTVYLKVKNTSLLFNADLYDAFSTNNFLDSVVCQLRNNSIIISSWKMQKLCFYS